MKLFTIGDSVSQGFMSLAAARIDLAYPTLIARSMNLEVGRDYRYPRWEAGGLLFGGEEQGLFGSKQYVAGLSASERARIQAFIKMDMIGSLNSPAPSSVLIEGAPMSQSVIDGLNEAAATYTQLTVQTSLQSANSDHVPFIRAGLPTVLTIEGADHTNGTVHSNEDTIDRIDYDLALEILRMNVAFIARILSKES